jgi:hypothetical protein
MRNPMDVEDDLKRLTQEQLIQEMRSPSGIAPQYMVLAEITRKTAESKALSAQQGKPPTVAQQAVAAAGVPQAGLPQMAQAMAPKTDVDGNTGIASLPQAQPKYMNKGGEVKSSYPAPPLAFLRDPAIQAMASRVGVRPGELWARMSPQEREITVARLERQNQMLMTPITRQDEVNRMVDSAMPPQSDLDQRYQEDALGFSASRPMSRPAETVDLDLVSGGAKATNHLPYSWDKRPPNQTTNIPGQLVDMPSALPMSQPDTMPERPPGSRPLAALLQMQGADPAAMPFVGGDSSIVSPGAVGPSRPSLADIGAPLYPLPGAGPETTPTYGVNPIPLELADLGAGYVTPPPSPFMQDFGDSPIPMGLSDETQALAATAQDAKQRELAAWSLRDRLASFDPIEDPAGRLVADAGARLGSITGYDPLSGQMVTMTEADRQAARDSAEAAAQAGRDAWRNLAAGANALPPGLQDVPPERLRDMTPEQIRTAMEVTTGTGLSSTEDLLPPSDVVPETETPASTTPDAETDTTTTPPGPQAPLGPRAPARTGGAGGVGGMSAYEQYLMGAAQRAERSAEQNKWLAVSQLGAAIAEGAGNPGGVVDMSPVIAGLREGQSSTEERRDRIAQQQAEWMLANQKLALSARSGGGGGGLNPYQSARLGLDAAKFDYERQKDAIQYWAGVRDSMEATPIQKLQATQNLELLMGQGNDPNSTLTLG